MAVTNIIITMMALSLAISGCATTPRVYTARSAAPCVQATISRVTDVDLVLADPQASYHTVRTGDTLWSIAKAYDVDLEALANANSIGGDNAITKGQVLMIPKAAGFKGRRPSRPRERAASFAWPVRGDIASGFGDKTEGVINKGIDIRAREGTNVAASRAGKVVYCDPLLKGFGMTVIIDHMDNFQTVYSYNSEITVKVGDLVRQDQMIARVGQSGRAKEPMLHFEIRRCGEPVDPARYLTR